MERKPLDLERPVRRDEVEGEGAIRGTSRMEAFADGVFAIAFTLPVITIAFPAVTRDGALLSSDLQGLGPAYAGYLLASLVIGLYWIQHHFSGAIYRTTGHWFLLASVLFLTMIGFIAFPARVLGEHWPDAAARPGAARYWVLALAITSLTWLIKWTVGVIRGQVDSRLDPAYIARLNRNYRLVFLGNVGASALVFAWWEAGLALSGLLMLWLAVPPETPRYVTRSPTIEGE